MCGDRPPSRTISIAVVCDGDEVLVTRRPPGTTYAGMDEFPGGHLESSETLEECARREVREETGLSIEVVRPLCEVAGSGPAAGLELHFLECRLVGERPAVHELPEGARWVRRSELQLLRFPPANHAVTAMLAANDLP